MKTSLFSRTVAQMRGLLLVLFATLASLGTAQAQYIWEYTPRPGEQRFNAFRYKATHNSYDRGVVLNGQIDDHNTWGLELDIWYRGTDSDGNHIVRVSHTDPTVFNPTLEEYLEEINNSVTKYDRFTMIFFDKKESGINYWPSSLESQRIVQAKVEAVLGANRIYTFAMFRDPNGDNGRWPSYQELVRRGKNFAVVLGSGDTGDFCFCYHNESAMPGNTAYLAPPNNIVYGAGHSNSGPSPSGQGDRFLSRAYPSGDEDTCTLQNWYGFWDWGIDKGFNFTATNCVDSEFTTTDERTHSPAPLFVIHDDQGNPTYGTYGFPYWGAHGLLSGIQRASPMVDVRISPGVYDVSGPLRITKPVVLKANGAGSVTIR